MSREREERVRALAARQHGLVSRTQLLAVGLSSSAIGRRTKGGRLQPIHAGVYLLGPLQTDRTPEMAATMAGGSTALLSHLSAATVWTIRPRPRPRPVHVSVPGGGRGRRRGIRFHRAERFDDDERCVVDGIPLTAVGRTLVDVAGFLGSREIERAVAVAERELDLLLAR